MRRLVKLGVTISLRTTLLLIVVVWIATRQFQIDIGTPKCGLYIGYLGPSVFVMPKSYQPYQFVFSERNKMHDSTADAWFSEQPAKLVGKNPEGFEFLGNSFHSWSSQSGLPYFCINIRHHYYFAIGVALNIGWWLYCWRSRKAV